jgi:hypothetical protein
MPTEEQTYRLYVKEKLESIETKVTYTNGKVRKIIIAMILIGGIIIGQAFSDSKDLIQFVAHLL